MTVELLKNYLGDLQYWRDMNDLDSFNFKTSGTPSMSSFEEADAYIAQVQSEIEKLEAHNANHSA